MKYYEANRSIKATPDKVWSVLTDTANYTSWDSGVVKVEGTISLGSTVKVYSSISPSRAFPVKVAELVPSQRMVWRGGMPVPGVFKGVRTFRLQEEDGGTRFEMREEFSGLMLPLMWRMMPDLQPTFDQFADGLKAESER